MQEVFSSLNFALRVKFVAQLLNCPIQSLESLEFYFQVKLVPQLSNKPIWSFKFRFYFKLIPQILFFYLFHSYSIPPFHMQLLFQYIECTNSFLTILSISYHNQFLYSYLLWIVRLTQLFYAQQVLVGSLLFAKLYSFIQANYVQKISY